MIPYLLKLENQHMNKTIILICMSVVLIKFSAAAQEDPYANKVKDLDAIMTTLYEVISGDKGEKRNWELFRYLFKPGAKLIPTGENEQGVGVARFMSPDDYIQRSGKWLEENGFFENEISRQVDTYGYITQIFSVYESFRSLTDKEPFMRGINSIQLLNDGERWWIINIFWMNETEGFPLPKTYLEDK